MNQLAFSPTQFAEVHGFSRALLYKLWKEGRGPKTAKVGTRTVITVEAAAEWRRRIDAEGEGVR